MKNILTAMFVVAFLLFMATSCKKTTTVNGGSWTFQDTTAGVVKYVVTSGIASLNQNSPVNTVLSNPYTISSLATVCKTSTSYSDIVFNFCTYPTVSGSYPITSNVFIDSGSNAVAINMIVSTGSNFTQKNYYPTPFSASTAMANVTVMGNGFIKISIPALELVNFNNPSDSGILTTSVMQTQPAE